MKVLQINSVCGVGSTGRIVTDIHQMLVEQGHESYIAFGRNLPMNCENTIRIGSKFENYKHVVKTRIFDKHGFGSMQSTIEFINRVKELDPDIIHIHNIHGYYLNVEILFDYLKEANKPVVWTLHDCWSFTGHCTHFDYVGCDKWKTGCFNCPQLMEYPKSFFTDNSEYNYYKKKEVFTGVKNLTIVTPSHWLTGLVNDSFLKDYQTLTVHNGIDLSVFKPTISNFKKKYNLDDKFIILGVANIWNYRKGFDFFLELSSHLDEDEIIVLIGLSEKQMRKVSDKIVGITQTNNVDDLVNIYSAADVFLNPTLEDNFPTVNLEALACGTPVISFDTGGSAESIDFRTGVVVSSDLEESINAFRYIKYKGDKSFLIDCVNRAKEKFDKYYAFKDYLDLYTEKNNKDRGPNENEHE